MDGFDTAYKLKHKCYRGNVQISAKSVVFVTILALYCYALCSNCSYCWKLNACYPLNSGDLASLRRVSATQRKCFTLFARTSLVLNVKVKSHIYNKYVISVRRCNKHWKAKLKFHAKYVKLAFLLTTPS